MLYMVVLLLSEAWVFPLCVSAGFRSSVQEPYQRGMSFAAYALPTMPCALDAAPWQPQPVSMRRLPFSHIMGLLVQDSRSGGLQQFSYGSADVVLGACTEFWDGEDLQPLTDSDRKKVLDFYQRSCMAGYCLALSFKPILHSQDPEIDGKCVDLTHAPHPNTTETTGAETEEHHTDPQDPLLLLKQHVLLGLVSSQYQARPDMVRLIAGLDSACIRFVYFSVEEEVKSKVFAEKMGLETGWNCHISLQSDRFPLDPDSLEMCEAQDEGDQEGDEDHLGEETRQVEQTAARAQDSEQACLIGDLNRVRETGLKAKLPKGIENVRPHLKNIDNVPLLVPLFTDCTPQTMCEMVQVMQEYGEVVCCLGSSQSINNNAVFLQSDVSIALEPLLPSCCWNTSDKPAPVTSQSYFTPFSPAQLTSALCGLPCTVHLGPQDNTAIIRLIKQARHTTASIRKCFLFLLQCQLSLVLIQLPPPLGTSDVLFLSCFYFPLISVSLLGKPSDSSVMKVPTGKNLRFLPKKTQRFFVFYFLVKFGLTVCTYLASFGFILHGFCLEINHEDSSLCHPAALLMNSSDSSPDWFGKHSDGLALAQKVIAFFVLLNAMCTSVSHVHRSAPMWKQSPFSNRYWCVVLITVPMLNVSIAMGSRFLWHDPTPHHTFFITDISAVSWLLGILWLLPLIFINEVIKLHEIRMRVRYQKRQKLQFDTKLGMNSPF
ncbi:hypothetical protein JZ751_026137 [Albula glossodonta]|uniref:Transmembrane protein 94 n=1 Tax=Albula glossodonta TaxID=121402 RepID=A0A8T2PB26_9TELE|nr:hypothetical protein JZ751_026137 [Albula glossodonta]